MSDSLWIVYVVSCADTSFYTGVTLAGRLDKRIAKHNAGVGSKYTASHRPVHELAVSIPMSKSDAFKLDAWVKKLPRIQKPDAVTNYRSTVSTTLYPKGTIT